MAHRYLATRCVVFAVFCAAACTSKPRAEVAPERTDLIVLLPDPDDRTVGRATASNQLGVVDLTSGFEATRVGVRRPPTPVVTMEKAEVEGTFRGLLAALPPAAVHFTLYFEFDSDDLTAESRQLTPRILQVVKSRPSPDVILVGHTDTTGSAASNYELGLQRATIVQSLLIAAGLDPTAIVLTSHGEGDLLIRTPDDTYEPRNRRVEIDIQ